MKTPEDFHETPAQKPAADAHSPGGAGLIPWAIVAFGPPSQPIERMMRLQIAVYRLIVAAENLGPSCRDAASELFRRLRMRRRQASGRGARS